MKNTPYPYQLDLLDKIETHIAQDIFPVVLAASCGSGKTFMSIYYIEGYLKRNPTAKVLVLAHGQTILRSQYHDNLKDQDPAFSYVEVVKGKDLLSKYSKKQVFVTLPQTLQKIVVPHFDLVVVDEAHQRYFAKQVEDIIKQAKPFHQLLLTGTPSPFIARNTPTKKEFNILTLPMSELLKEGAITDVLVELASTTYPISGEDYNQEGNLKETFKFEDLDTTTTLDNLLDKIHKRLKSVVKNNPTLYSALPKLFDWVSTLKSLEKTMFACHSQEQARQVAAYFKSKNINVALSTSDDDLEAEEVDRFVNEKDCAVLIVVGRGVLGFNFEELVNVVDMTGSQNIDRIFQLMARVVRKHPKGYKKLFFKIVPRTMASYFEHLMTGVLCLTCEEWYTKYNGHNFLQLPLPIRKEPVHSISTVLNRKKSGSKQIIKPIEFVGLPAIRLFNDITHKDGSEFNSYEWTTLGHVREQLLGIGTWNSMPNKKEVLDFVTTYKRKPNQKIEEEKRLFVLTARYCSPSQQAFDPEFKQTIDNLIIDKQTESKKEILVFIQKNNRKPSENSMDEKERKLAGRLLRYVIPSSEDLDVDFKNKVDLLVPLRVLNNRKNTKQEILDFTTAAGRKPSVRAKEEKEKKLGQCMQNLCTPSSPSFDKIFRKQLDKLIPRRVFNSKQTKQNILKFIKDNRHRPSTNSKNVVERRLSFRLRAYKGQLGRYCKDLIFIQQVDDLCKDLGI